jgi:acyl carrier protein
MEEFLSKIASVLELDRVQAADMLAGFSQWDSLAVLSVIAMLDSAYGINLRAAELKAVRTAGELWSLVQSKKSS